MGDTHNSRDDFKESRRSRTFLDVCSVRAPFLGDFLVDTICFDPFISNKLFLNNSWTECTQHIFILVSFVYIAGHIEAPLNGHYVVWIIQL